MKPISPTPDRFETHVDRVIRDAIERGEFDRLDGEGEPLPGAGEVDDPHWWVRGWLARNTDDGHPDGLVSSS